MTIQELTYNIRNLIKIARPDDLNISDRQIQFMINYIREKLIVQQLQKGRSISSNIKQDLGQVEVQAVDTAAPGTIVVGNNIFRTVKTIPQPIELDQMDLFTYIGGLDKQSGYPYKTKANVRWNQYNKYASKEPLAYYSNGYVFITGCNNPLLKYINIEGVFSNPKEATIFTKVDGSSCYNPDVDKYPISGKMISDLNTLIKSKELDLFLQIAEKNTNDASSEQ